jgi:hypothetical protein
VDPSILLDPIKNNVVVQWFLIAIFILTVSTSTAAKLKGPIGSAARAFQRLGERRVNRESDERRKARQTLLRQAAEGRAFAEEEISSLRDQLDAVMDERDALARLIRQHMGWDHDRVRELITFGVRPGDIPTPPPLRVPWRTPRSDTRELRTLHVPIEDVPTAQLAVQLSTDSGENPMVVRSDS